MSDKSKIEWTDATWNPIRGCSRVSEGCRHCYAERIAARFSGPGKPYEGLATMKILKVGGAGLVPVPTGIEPRWTGEVRFIPRLLEQPLRWRRPRKIFVNSMSDLFHEKVTDDQIKQIFGVMARCEHHTFQILTKRAARAQEWMAARFHGRGRLDIGPPHNVWLGVSVEDQKTADERIPLLLQTPAAVRWLSYEPALGPVDFNEWLKIAWQCSACKTLFSGPLKPICPKCGKSHYWTGSHPFNPNDGQVGSGLNWIVAGGESGPGARPAHPQWMRAARDQCTAAGVPFFFKQWGEWLNSTQLRPAFSDAELDRIVFKTVRREPENNKPNAGLADLYFRVGKKRAGHLLDGILWQEFPAVRP